MSRQLTYSTVLMTWLLRMQSQSGKGTVLNSDYLLQHGYFRARADYELANLSLLGCPVQNAWLHTPVLTISGGYAMLD